MPSHRVMQFTQKYHDIVKSLVVLITTHDDVIKPAAAGPVMPVLSSHPAL